MKRKGTTDAKTFHQKVDENELMNCHHLHPYFSFTNPPKLNKNEDSNEREMVKIFYSDNLFVTF